jgi:hypothetical protein
MENLVTCLWNLNIKLIGLLKLSIQTLMMLASCVMAEEEFCFASFCHPGQMADNGTP